ncbi:membrane protein [Pandoraea thiooxydans]|uniref:TM2 domain-containing protein n=1 Tax=Pandoraea thiooxydans TaxID=445709 RepID=A0A0G3EV97_9BURK|nr:TM2 domain-containing protein [Pandoraea thiooxydans]AKJ68661.1 hypothetical protein ABW99_11005 [Pandoraea thiooxydans]APR96093.1 membrane protein [Pandoraea thiooxydans]
MAYKSKTVAALLAFALGTLGGHRFYLYGPRDAFGWLHLLGTLLGIDGWRLLTHSQLMSPLGWALTICGAVSLFSSLLAAIVYGLRPDEAWNSRFNSQSLRKSRSGWSAILIVSASLFIGAGLMMFGFVVGFQTYFETHLPPNSLSQ